MHFCLPDLKRRSMMEQPITAVIGGLGVRGYEVYASYARRNPDKIRIVAVADPDPAKRTAAREPCRRKLL